MILDDEYSGGGFGDSIGAGAPYLLPSTGETLRMELLQSGLGNPWPVAYGRHIVGGNVIFQQVNSDETTTLLVALGEGEWDAIENLWINGVEQTLPNTDLIHFHPGLDGEQGTESDPGTANAKICSFYPSFFTPRLTFSRLVYLALNLPPDVEAPDASWDVRGIYRTRKVRIFDASGNQTAYEYSANPAWCILDLLIGRWIKPHGLINEALTTAEKARIDFATFVSAATYCAADPGDGAARFESHVAFIEKTDLLRALDQMLLICRGYLLERNGKLALFIDQARSSELTVTRDMIGAGSLYYPRKDLRNLANRLEIKYRHLNSGNGDEAKDFQPVTLEVEDHDHQDQVGRVISAAIDFGNTTPGRAARLGYYIRDRSLVLAEQAHLRILGGAEGSNPIDLLPGDRITAPKDLDGFEAEDYEILEITDEPDGSREAFAQKYDPSVFQEAQADPQIIFPTDPNLETGIPGQVSDLTVTGGNGSFIANWSDPAENARTLDNVCFQYATDSDFAEIVSTQIGWGKVNRLLIVHPDMTCWFRVALRNRSLAESNVLVKAAIEAIGGEADYGWGPWSNTAGPIYSGAVYTDEDVPEAPDPATGQFLVEVFRMANGDWKIVFGAEFPTTNNNTADWVQFQISRTPFDPSPDIVYDKTLAVPANDEYITSETHVWYLRARYHNIQGWSDWSTEVVRQEQDFEDGDDTGEPGAVQNLTVKSDDIDTSIPGKELLVQWDTPETNFRSLFCYAVQVHTGASPPSNSVIWSSLVGSGDRGGFFIDDTTANFTAGSHLNKTIWIHSASPMTDANLITTGIVKEIISTTRIRISPFPLDIGGTAIKYQIITPSWEAAGTTASFDVPVKRLDGFIMTAKNYEYIISRLPSGAYYVTVWAANKYGQGPKTTVGPYTVDGYKTGDIKDAAISEPKIASGAVSEPKIASGAVSPRVMDGAARSQHGVFMETFEILPSDWRVRYGVGEESIVDGQGQTGGKVYRVTGGARWIVYPSNIPYDSSKLYRIRSRVRRTSPGTASVFYVGLCGYAADGVTRVNTLGLDDDDNQHYFCMAGTQPPDGVWTEYTGWFKGWSATPPETPSTDPLNPQPMHNNIRYFRPLVVINWGGTETHDIDYIAIDVFDEEGVDRTYRGIESGTGMIRDGRVSNRALTNDLWGAHGFTETWEQVAVSGDVPGLPWSIFSVNGSPQISKVALGRHGGYVLYVHGAGYCVVAVGTDYLLPYDPTKLYRMRINLRRRNADAASYVAYCGVICYDKDKNSLDGGNGYWRVMNNQAQTWTIDEWQTKTGFWKGLAASPGYAEAPSPTSPTALINGTAYIQPCFIVNYGASSGDPQIEIDDVTIDVQEEEGTSRTYTAINTDGTIKTGKVITDSLGAGAATSSKVNAALRGWSHTLVFSVGDQDTVNWAAGTILLSDGTTLNINAGSSGNMSGRTYIYLDVGVSTTVLQITTTAANGVGDGRILIATAAPGTTEASFFVFSGGAGINVDGANIAARSITANEIATGTLTANEILAGTLTVNQMVANFLDAYTITGATIQTAASGNRIVMTSDYLSCIYGGQTIFNISAARGYAEALSMKSGSFWCGANEYSPDSSMSDSAIKAPSYYVGGSQVISATKVFAGLDCDMSGAYKRGGTQVVGAQGAAVADCDAGTVVAQLNALLARLRTHGLIAT